MTNRRSSDYGRLTAGSKTRLAESTKKEGGRVNDVTPATLAKRPDKSPGQFLSVMGGQLWYDACYSNVVSTMVSITQHVNGQEHIKKVPIYIHAHNTHTHNTHTDTHTDTGVCDRD